jgi:hypothetical protein
VSLLSRFFAPPAGRNRSRGWHEYEVVSRAKPCDTTSGRRAGPTALVSAVIATFVLVSLSGCASGRAGGERADGETAAGDTAAGDTTGAGQPAGTLSATVTVENTSSEGRAFAIHLVSATGQRVQLGSVGPQRTETFQAEGLPLSTSYRLMAQAAGARDVVSDRFALPAGGSVHWLLPYNTLRTSQ